MPAYPEGEPASQTARQNNGKRSALVRQHAIYQKVTPYGFHQKSGLYSRKGVVHRRPVPGVRQAAYQGRNGAHWILLRPRGLRSLQSWKRLRTIRMRTGQFRPFSGFRRSIRRLRDWSETRTTSLRPRHVFPIGRCRLHPRIRTTLRLCGNGSTTAGRCGPCSGAETEALDNRREWRMSTCRRGCPAARLRGHQQRP
jgi:hypothetical protein